MNINLFPFTVLGMILATAAIGLIAYREWVAKDEDDSLDVMGVEFSTWRAGRSSSAQATCMRTEIEEKGYDVTT